jgi:hypothetical protein
MIFLEILYELWTLIDATPYWRVIVGLALTGFACWLVFLLTPGEVLQWTICTPLAIGGVWSSFRWHESSSATLAEEAERTQAGV